MKITKRARGAGDREQISVKTQANSSKAKQGYQWWKAQTKKELASQVLDTAAFLKQNQQYRFRQASIYSRLYGNMPISNFIGANFTRASTGGSLPVDRPTMNVIQSCIDTKTARITQTRPRPLFLTDDGDSRQRKLAKQMNSFIAGEFYQTKAYELGEMILNNAQVIGTGAVKIIRTLDGRVGLERRLVTELCVDPNEALYGDPRQLLEFKLIDRAMLAQYYPDFRASIDRAEQGFLDDSEDSSRTISDMIIVVEAWRLPSGKDTGDGRHCIVCSSGTILDEKYEKGHFPFVFLHDTPRVLGFWGQGTPERLMGTQTNINKLLMLITRSIDLFGVPRILYEDGSKIIKAHFNNVIGSMISYRGTKPDFLEGSSGLTSDIYAQLQRLIQYAYQQEGISQMAANSEKPAGLDSGEAIRSYDNMQTDRMYSLNKRYAVFYEELAYHIMDKAIDIAEETGKYETVYPGKNGTKTIDLPKVDRENDPFVIQCYDTSSLPRDPAGRKQAIVEDMQAGIITQQEGRRLLNYPDLEQADSLAIACEERILQILDEIVEDGKYTPPDPFLFSEPGLAEQLTVQYINKWSMNDLAESRLQDLRNFYAQILTMKQAAMAGAPGPQGPGVGAPSGQPTGVPAAAPVSDQLPNVPTAA